MNEPQMVLAGKYIDPARLPEGWTATVEELKPGRWEVRVYEPQGGCFYINSMVPNPEQVYAIAHREAWTDYAEVVARG